VLINKVSCPEVLSSSAEQAVDYLAVAVVAAAVEPGVVAQVVVSAALAVVVPVEPEAVLQASASAAPAEVAQVVVAVALAVVVPAEVSVEPVAA